MKNKRTRVFSSTIFSLLADTLINMVIGSQFNVEKAYAKQPLDFRDFWFVPCVCALLCQQLKGLFFFLVSLRFRPAAVRFSTLHFSPLSFSFT